MERKSVLIILHDTKVLAFSLGTDSGQSIHSTSLLIETSHLALQIIQKKEGTAR